MNRHRRFASVLVAVSVLVATAMGTVPAQAKAASIAFGVPTRAANVRPLDPSMYATALIDYGSRMCMDTQYSGSAATPGENIVQHYCSNADYRTQRWGVNVDGNYHEIQNLAYPINGIPQCLALPGGNAIIGWQLELYNCNGEPDQQWAFSQHGSSWVVWNKKASDRGDPLVIAVWGGSQSDGAPVELYHWEAHPDQSWIVPGSL